MMEDQDIANLRRLRSKAIQTSEANRPLTFESLLQPRHPILWNISKMAKHHNIHDVDNLVSALIAEIADAIP